MGRPLRLDELWTYAEARAKLARHPDDRDGFNLLADNLRIHCSQRLARTVNGLGAVAGTLGEPPEPLDTGGLVPHLRRLMPRRWWRTR